MTSPSAPDPSRRTVLATGSALGGVLLTSGLPAQTAAADQFETEPAAAFADPWRTVLDDADLVWRQMPATWYEGPFLGNGFLGSGIYAEPGAEPAPSTAVRFNVQHSEVQDHRPEFGSLFGLARLPIGHFTLEPVGAITGLDWRLGLRDAELTGTLTTDRGTLSLRALVHNDRSVLAVEVTPSEGERDFRWVFHPAEAISPRAAFKPLPDGYRGNPPAEVADHDGVDGRRTAAAGGRAARHRVAGADPGPDADAVRPCRALVSADDGPGPRARGGPCRATDWPYAALAAPHRAWWHAYYRKSFLSVPDARMQRFYWIQLYKTASAARRDAPVMATCGPWLEPTPWPNTWWNLNVQLEYWLDPRLQPPRTRRRHTGVERVPGQPRRGGAGPVPRRLARHPAHHRHPVSSTVRPVALMGYGVGIPGQDPPTPEVGNLTWALHNVWLSYRHTMDRSILRDVLFPLLRGAINYYLHFLEPGADGRLHLPATFSPEYGGNSPRLQLRPDAADLGLPHPARIRRTPAASTTRWSPAGVRCWRSWRRTRRTRTAS